MKVVKQGKPLIVPTEEATCPQCEAVLMYSADDVVGPPPWMGRFDDKEERERFIRAAHIRCPECKQLFATNKRPAYPHY